MIMITIDSSLFCNRRQENLMRFPKAVNQYQYHHHHQQQMNSKIKLLLSNDDRRLRAFHSIQPLRPS